VGVNPERAGGHLGVVALQRFTHRSQTGLDLSAEFHDLRDQLVELAGERGDLEGLRRLADLGSPDAIDQLVELAAERGDTAELRRLADRGSRDAADVLVELEEERDDE